MKLNLEHPRISGETTVQNAITEIAAMMGENVRLRRGVIMSTSSPAVISTYLHTSPQPGRLFWELSCFALWKIFVLALERCTHTVISLNAACKMPDAWLFAWTRGSGTGKGLIWFSPLKFCPDVGLGRIAGLLSLEIEDGNSQLEALQHVGSELAMHVVAAKPLFLTKELVSSNALESEREILKSQVLWDSLLAVSCAM